MVVLRFLFLAALALAGPVQTKKGISSQDLINIDPRTASCGGEAIECRTASQAAPFISASFQIFGIDDFNTQAALVALMMYESAGFNYSRNHYPGIAGQGTFNMQSPLYNKKYAQFLANVQGSGISSSQYQKAESQGSAYILALINSQDLWSFSSAAWFFATQCSPSVKSALAEGTHAGWSAYLTLCIGTAATNDRTQLLDKIMASSKWTE